MVNPANIDIKIKNSSEGESWPLSAAMVVEWLPPMKT